MIVYLTFNDAPSGIYQSQVVDVCKFYTNSLNTPVKLVAYISVRGFLANRKKIKKEYPNSIVLPMFPKQRNWRANIITLRLLLFFLPVKVIIARGPFAANLALDVQGLRPGRKVVFDARGAYAAEFNEYEVVSDASLKIEIADIEKRAVMQCDHRLAVSHQLVNYWKESFGYSLNSHEVIPCTTEFEHLSSDLSETAISEAKKRMGIGPDDIVLVYAGSMAGWQSFELLNDFISKVMEENKNVKVLLLVRKIPGGFDVYEKFRERIIHKWFESHEVSSALLACDYGLLLRERSVTNNVSSPTKFAEYLSSGLKVLITDQIGDFSEFVKTHDCGMVIGDKSFELAKVDFPTKQRMKMLSLSHFSKNVFRSSYLKFIK